MRRPVVGNSCPSINGLFRAGRRSPRLCGCDVRRVRLTANPCAALSNTNYEERSFSAKIRISELDPEYHYFVVDGH